MSDPAIEVERAAVVRAAVRGLAPELTARAAEGDSLRTLPEGLVEQMKPAGLFRLALPHSLGSLDLDPATLELNCSRS